MGQSYGQLVRYAIPLKAWLKRKKDGDNLLLEWGTPGMRNLTGSWRYRAILLLIMLSFAGSPALAKAPRQDHVVPSFANADAAGDPGQTSAQDACRRAGEGRFPSPDPARCQGVWVIYASFSGGGTWWHDKDGVDPLARHIGRRAALLQARLARCGLRAFVSLSDWFDRFTPGLAVVHSQPYATSARADANLRAARRCGIAGYAKFSELQIVGRD